jgi:hypothetical protein
MKTITPEGTQNYRLDTMSNKVLQESLLAIMKMLIRDKDNAWRLQTAKQLLEIFEQWKAEHGCKKPRTRRDVRGLDAFRSVAFEDAAPYECADPKTGVTDYVSLFRYLAKTEYPPAVAILESEDMRDVVVLSALIEPASVQLSSLLYELDIALDSLTRQESLREQVLSQAAPILRSSAASRKGLAKAQPLGTDKKKATAAELHKAWRQAAIDYLTRCPNKTLDNAASYIEAAPNLNPPNAKGKKKALATIRDVITGCDKEALAQLSKAPKVRQV